MVKPGSKYRPLDFWSRVLSALLQDLQLCWAMVALCTSFPFLHAISPMPSRMVNTQCAWSQVQVLGFCWPTWHHVIVVGQGITVIENKQLPLVKTIRKLFQVLVDAALELEHFLTHSLCMEKQQEVWGDKQRTVRSSTERRGGRDAKEGAPGSHYRTPRNCWPRGSRDQLARPCLPGGWVTTALRAFAL